jgi:hypothetical protein
MSVSDMFRQRAATEFLVKKDSSATETSMGDFVVCVCVCGGGGNNTKMDLFKILFCGEWLLFVLESFILVVKKVM